MKLGIVSTPQGPMLGNVDTGELIENCSEYTISMNAHTHGVIEIEAKFFEIYASKKAQDKKEKVIAVHKW